MQQIDVLQSIIKVQGKVFYNDGRRRIDIKKPIRDIFEPLEGGQTTIVYTMELCLSKKKVIARTQELIENGVIPVLFYFAKEE